MRNRLPRGDIYLSMWAAARKSDGRLWLARIQSGGRLRLRLGEDEQPVSTVELEREEEVEEEKMEEITAWDNTAQSLTDTELQIIRLRMQLQWERQDSQTGRRADSCLSVKTCVHPSVCLSVSQSPCFSLSRWITIHGGRAGMHRDTYHRKNLLVCVCVFDCSHVFILFFSAMYVVSAPSVKVRHWDKLGSSHEIGRSSINTTQSKFHYLPPITISSGCARTGRRRRRRREKTRQTRHYSKFIFLLPILPNSWTRGEDTTKLYSSRSSVCA